MDQIKRLLWVKKGAEANRDSKHTHTQCSLMRCLLSLIDSETKRIKNPGLDYFNLNSSTTAGDPGS